IKSPLDSASTRTQIVQRSKKFVREFNKLLHRSISVVKVSWRAPASCWRAGDEPKAARPGLRTGAKDGSTRDIGVCSASDRRSGAFFVLAHSDRARGAQR